MKSKKSLLYGAYLDTIFMLPHFKVAYERKIIMELLFVGIVGIAIIAAIIAAITSTVSAAAAFSDEDED